MLSESSAGRLVQLINCHREKDRYILILVSYEYSVKIALCWVGARLGSGSTQYVNKYILALLNLDSHVGTQYLLTMAHTDRYTNATRTLLAQYANPHPIIYHQLTSRRRVWICPCTLQPFPISMVFMADCRSAVDRGGGHRI